MAWRCRFLSARPSQDAGAIAENDLVKSAPDALVDFHNERAACKQFGSLFANSSDSLSFVQSTVRQVLALAFRPVKNNSCARSVLVRFS